MELLQLIMKRIYLVYGIIGVTALITGIYFLQTKQTDTESSPRDYNEINNSRTLNVTTEYNAVSYYVEGDSVSGFHYELVQAFAQEKGWKLNIAPEMDLGKQMKDINDGSIDLIANSLLVTSESKDSLIAFTIPILRNKQVLVQRKKEISTNYIHNQLELSGKTVYIPCQSAIRHRIHNLSKEIGDTIIVQELEKYGTEQLMALVAHGDIDYAVCEVGIVKATLSEFPQLDIQTDVSFNQFYAWGVNKQSTILLDSLNHWLTRFMQTDKYKRLIRKYQAN